MSPPADVTSRRVLGLSVLLSPVTNELPIKARAKGPSHLAVGRGPPLALQFSTPGCAFTLCPWGSRTAGLLAWSVWTRFWARHLWQLELGEMGLLPVVAGRWVLLLSSFLPTFPAEVHRPAAPQNPRVNGARSQSEKGRASCNGGASLQASLGRTSSPCTPGRMLVLARPTSEPLQPGHHEWQGEIWAFSC